MDKLEDLLKTLLKNGLKFLQSIANCLEPIYNTWVMKYLYKTTEYVCNPGEAFLSMFCSKLQKLFKPIYNLTRKGRPFIWVKE